MRSLADTWYQLGFFFHAGSDTAAPKVEPTGFFHAGSDTAAPKVEPTGAFCVTAITSATSAGRYSPARTKCRRTWPMKNSS